MVYRVFTYPIYTCMVTHFSRVHLFMTGRALVHQTPLSMEFSRQVVLEQVTMPSCRGSSQPRDRTHVSYVSSLVGRFFTTSATRYREITLYLVSSIINNIHIVYLLQRVSQYINRYIVIN